MKYAFEDGYDRGYSEGYKVGFNTAIDKAVEAIHKVVEDTGIPQDFDMDDLLDIEWDIVEELNKLKEIWDGTKDNAL